MQNWEKELHDHHNNQVDALNKAWDSFDFETNPMDIMKGGVKGVMGEIRVHNGKRYKKIGEGKWVEVSEHGMTKKEHGDKAEFHSATSEGWAKQRDWDRANKEVNELRNHKEQASKLSDKEHTDEEVGLGSNSLEIGSKYHIKAPEGGEGIDFEIKSIVNGQYKIETKNAEGRKNTHVFNKEILMELINKSKSFSKSDSNDLEKGGKRAQEGEIRIWSGQKMQKKGGVWVPVKESSTTKKEELVRVPTQGFKLGDHIKYFHSGLNKSLTGRVTDVNDPIDGEYTYTIKRDGTTDYHEGIRQSDISLSRLN